MLLRNRSNSRVCFGVARCIEKKHRRTYTAVWIVTLSTIPLRRRPDAKLGCKTLLSRLEHATTCGLKNTPLQPAQ
ncbi:hypothetical protein IE81DRAFT_325258 [Ceraceosorus guamensis]|uniref:Uncharacterized protein n=1 Tax=Ceraceosorus guamensis TaxID=1522189 RepID=A0A316VTK4_9BASI|nr:hypothetical protein IE81DRAFT_325258 [Ceraceosorus guamensis]PWN40730.1 hypothetical protein IE81DRAFT_325258 [Ceraceosorus guamensis]